MGRALNSTVNGSAGTCVEAADALEGVHQESTSAANSARAARATADASWHGPAHDQFADGTSGLDNEIIQLSDRSFQVEQALRDFAGALDTVNTKMDTAIFKAKSAGLQVDGPFIVAPDQPAKPNLDGTIATSAEGAQQIASKNRSSIDAYNGQVAEYNAKATAFNEVKHIVEDARRIEGEAHDALGRIVGQKPNDLAKIGLFTASRIAGATGSFEGGRRTAQIMVDKLTERGRIYTNWANGLVGEVTPQTRKALQDAADKAGKDADKYRAKVADYDRFTDPMNAKFRSAIQAYPGRASIEALPEHVDPLVKGGAKLLKGLPFVGGVLTMGTEAYGAAKGEQTWGKAAVHTGTNLVGGALGGIAGGAFAGAISAGPVGALVLGTAGGIGGAIGLTWFVDTASEPYKPPDTSDLSPVAPMSKP